MSPAWLAAPAMNARNTTKVYIWRLDTRCGLDVDPHYIGIVTAYSIDKFCVRCRDSEETANHIICACQNVANIWKKNVVFQFDINILKESSSKMYTPF